MTAKKKPKVYITRKLPDAVETACGNSSMPS